MADRTRELEIRIIALDKASKTLKNIGGTLTGIGKKMTLGVTAPIVAMGALAVSAASDLDESMNKVQVVFGEASGAIEDFAKGAATNLGISTSEALEAAGTFGNLFTAMGIGRGVASDMSQDILTLAADLASFNNLDPTDVLNKLRAGLVGEVEPLRTLGVNLNQAAIEAKAFEMGLIGQGEALTAAAKSQAAFALIMEQTTNAQGDFARTSDGMANSMRIVKAQISDIAAEFGMVLLPIVTDLINAIRPLLDRFKEMSPATKKIIVIVAALAAAIGPVLIVVGSLVSAVGAIAPVIGAVGAVISGALIPALAAAIPLIISAIVAMGPILLIVGAIIAVIALLALAWKNNWGGIRDKIQAAWSSIKSIFDNIIKYFGFIIEEGDTLNDFLANLPKWLQGPIQKIGEIFANVIEVIKTIFAAFQAAFRGDWRGFGEALRKLWDLTWGKMIERIKGFWETIKTIIPKIVKSIVDFFKNTDWKQVGINILKGIAKGITSAIKWIKDAARKAAQAAIDAAKGFLGIKSPSAEFQKIGNQMIKGMAKGIGDNYRIPATAMVGAAQNVTNVVSQPGAGPSSFMGAGQGSIEININIEKMNDQIDLEMMAETVVNRIREVSI